MRSALTAASLLIAFLTVPPAFADGDSGQGCDATTSLQTSVATCSIPATNVAGFYSSGDGHTYTISPACGTSGGVCHSTTFCQPSQDGDPVLYNLFQDGIKIGTTCLTPAQTDALGTVTPARVLTAFRTLAWPASELIIQPPDGTTLVNIATNFYTTNTAPVTRTVTLLGRQITIEATPATYTWHFDQSHSETTASPGARYPDLDVTHTYTDAGLTVRPSVDTTYTGRFRIGTGPWQTIPGTVTITGTATTLDIIEARGVLVGN